jgi:hypothetical protein
MPVCDQDLENLRASGLSNATIRTAGLRTEGGALHFPYRDLDGHVNCFRRWRPHHPKTIDGQVAKYMQAKGSPLRAYYPPASLAKLRDGESDIYITEGEKKALALAQLGYAAVGITGIWCGCKKDSEELIDDLAVIPLEGRKVLIVFDYDAKVTARNDAAAARARLARALKGAGAGEVCHVQLPGGPGGAKQGVDDYLMACGAPAFAELAAKAIRVIKIINVAPPALGAAAYHGPIGDFLRALEPHTEATAAGILAHLLPGLGTVIGPGPHICAGGIRQHARVNTILVGPTSTGRKGTALAPVDELMRKVDAPLWRTQRVGGLSTGEGLVQKVAGPLKERRLYVVEEEFSKVLAQLRRDGNILSQILRESYDSGNLNVLTRNDPLQASGAHIAVTGHITQEELKDRFNHIEMANGFGNRFLWFLVKSDKVLPRCQPLPARLFNTFVPTIRAVAKYPAKHIPLARASMGRWEKEIYPALREDKPGFAGSLTARGSSMVLRVALIYFLLDPPPKGASQGIAPVHLDAAMAVWAYCEESVQALFQGQGGSFMADKLLGLLAHGGLTRDQLNDHLSPRQKAEASGALLELERAGLVCQEKVEKTGRGRPATRWFRLG